MATQEQIIEKMRNQIRVQHYSLRTEECYVHWVVRYCGFLKAVDAGLSSTAKVEAFLTDLARRQQVAAKTQNQAFAAVLYLYKHVLKQPLGNIDALRAKRPEHVREAPTREEVVALLKELSDTPDNPAGLLARLLYGCGLRVQEPLELRIKDVRISESILIIRAAKGAEDPRTIQRVMGHAQLETTMGYIHRDVVKAQSPLELLGI